MSALDAPLKIGQSVEFVGPDGATYRGRIVNVAGGIPTASVDGYGVLFPLVPVTPQQAITAAVLAAGATQ